MYEVRICQAIEQASFLFLEGQCCISYYGNCSPSKEAVPSNKLGLITSAAQQARFQSNLRSMIHLMQQHLV